MFKSIRAKFLAFFLVSIMLTLMLALVISYISIDSVYININERVIQAEFNQISSDIKRLVEETDDLLSTRITTNEAMRQLAAYEKNTTADLTYAVNDLSKEVVQMTGLYPHITSVYIYVNQDWFLAMSRYNTRQFVAPTVDWPSDRILSEMECSETSLKLTGYVFDQDFPLNMEETAYLGVHKKVFSIYGTSICWLNMKESALFNIYSGYVEDGLRSIRILDSEGTIISSGDKLEIGSKYELLKDISLSESGTYNADGMVTNYMPIKEYGLVIVNTIPASVYTSELNNLRNLMLVIFALSMIIVTIIFSTWISWRLKPLTALRQEMHKAGNGDYPLPLKVVGDDEFADLTKDFNAMLSDLDQLEKSHKRDAEELRERELAVLRNEINPHFLYNTLNTIKCLADLDGNEEISRCAVALGGIIAPLYKVKDPVWPLQDELILVQKYLEIMNIRYGNRISYVERVPDDLLKQPIMRFVLQPIIENAIQHGFAENGYAGTVSVTAEVLDGILKISIADNGCGLSDIRITELNELLRSGRETQGVGMMNVSRRITLRYGKQFGAHLEPTDSGGLCVVLLLPSDDLNN